MKKKAKKILLIGYRATGKTAVGKELSRVLGCPFIDLDQVIEREASKTISQIVEEEGWEGFRKREEKALKEALDRPKRFVLACGGGAVLHEEIMEEFKKKALIVWLKAPFEVMMKRLLSDSKSATMRPSLTGKNLKEEITKTYEKRRPLYEKFSHISVDTNEKSPFQIAQEINEALTYAW